MDLCPDGAAANEFHTGVTGELFVSGPELLWPGIVVQVGLG